MNHTPFARIIYIVSTLLTVALFSCRSDMELLREKFIDEQMQGKVDEARIRSLMESLREDGTWPGINYSDTSRTGFQHSEHLDNMIAMARAYRMKDSPMKGSNDLKKAIDSSLGFWLKEDFICENWWWNQIGTPNAIVSLLFILDEELTREQQEKMLEIAGRAHLNASGARPSGDRIKIAGILAKTTLFRRDEKQAEEVMKVIEGEIKFAPEEKQQLNAEGKPSGERLVFPGTGRGMQADYSFHHRADRVNNTLSYGLGYADAFAEWAANVAGTRFSFSDSSLKQLIDYYLDGICKQMVFGRIPDPGIRNRDISRHESGRPMSVLTPQRLIRASDYRRQELEEIIRARSGQPFIVKPFAKFFWQTEHFVFQRPGFYASVRMYSVRNRNMEQPYNGEGLRNHYRGDGTNHISLSGTEYFNIAPVLDYRKIPGTTILEGDSMPPENEIQKNGLNVFAGGVTDGLYGAAALDFISPHDGTRARKSWFFFDNEYICLGSGIRSDNSSHAVATTLNQCLLDGDVTVKTTEGINIIPAGDRNLEKTVWILHDSIGYIFNSPRTVRLVNNTASGTWFSINRQHDSPREEINKELFKLWIDHGKAPRDASYEYVVMPGTTVKEVEEYISSPSITVASNSSGIQSVYHNGLGIGYAVFYDPGTVDLAGKITISSESPVMVMVMMEGEKIKSLTVSDPCRTLDKARISLNRKIDKSISGCSIEWDAGRNISILDIDLPREKNRGSSTTINLM